jgi:tetratricopeptide (TPR) repeat protein
MTMRSVQSVVFFCLLSMVGAESFPCTIISGKTKDGVVWAGNNEDFYFDFNTYLNALPPEGDLLGAISFTYGSPESFIQGGVNEHGLFFDFNALPSIPQSEFMDWGERQDFPGGENNLVMHILRTCSSVHDAIELIKKYDMDLASAQMHFADRQGNLAIINASGIRLSRTNYQVSTNFNVFTRGPSSGGRSCWRYPVAEKMLREGSVRFEMIRDVLDATQQPRFYGTIYSNVINLATGDVYNYYAGDFEHVFHFKIRDLLKKGKKSHLFRSFFSDAPIVRIWDTYQAKGADDAVALFRELRDTLPRERRAEMLRHLFSSCLLRLNRFRDARVFFDEWLKVSGGQDRATNLYNALIDLSNGDYENSKILLKKQIRADTTDGLAQKAYPPLAKTLLARLEEGKPPGANARFELRGYQEAGFVGLFLVDELPVLNFLLKTPEGWYGDFALSPGRNPYAFIVDGERILDPANPEREVIDTEDGKIELNIKEVK